MPCRSRQVAHPSKWPTAPSSAARATRPRVPGTPTGGPHTRVLRSWTTYQMQGSGDSTNGVDGTWETASVGSLPGGVYTTMDIGRSERRTRHSGGPVTRRAYPLVRLMRCTRCQSSYQGDANGGTRRVRHVLRPACGPSASHRADQHEDQVARVLERVHLIEDDVTQVLGAIRRVADAPTPAPDPDAVASRKAELQASLAAGTMSLAAFSRAWRALERPAPQQTAPPDELALRRARRGAGAVGLRRALARPCCA